MSRKKKSSRKETQKCIYCGREVPVLPNGNIKPHILHKGIRCLGVGSARSMQILLSAKE